MKNFGITTTYKVLIDSVPAFTALSGKDMKAHNSARLAIIGNELQPLLDVYQAEIKKILTQYATPPTTFEGDTPPPLRRDDVPPEHRRTVDEEVDALLATEVPLNVIPLPLSTLAEVEVNAQTLMPLMYLIDMES